MRIGFNAPIIILAAFAAAPVSAQAANDAVDVNVAADANMMAGNEILPADDMNVGMADPAMAEPVPTGSEPAYAPTRKTSEGFPWGLLGLLGLVGLIGKGRRKRTDT